MKHNKTTHENIKGHVENHDADDDVEDDLNVIEVSILIAHLAFARLSVAIQSHVCCFSLAHA